jgi:hypothetical protein
MKILSVKPPDLVWNINANWDGEDAWFVFEYLHDDGSTEQIQSSEDSLCTIPQSDDFVKVRVTVRDRFWDGEILATEDILIRPK